VRAFEGDAMWIWLLNRSSGGNVDRIAARARSHGLELVIMKGADGVSRYGQLSPGFVRAMHDRGLRVCGYQFVFGRRPLTEARVGARVAATGIDCLMVDAESAYEGRYVAAQTYMRNLRTRVGPNFPIGLTSFPYVHYHPGFPYSVFLGPGAAEFNLPQIYWRAIGTSVDKAIATTYIYNRVYERPIDPLGQLYMDPRGREILRFRKLARASGFGGVSWWSWQHASARGWRAAGRRRLGTTRGYAPTRTYPELARGAAGDLVVWAQLHLISGGYLGSQATGRYASLTERAVGEFQLAAGLPPSGVTDAATWQQLLARLDPAAVTWSARRSAGRAGADSTTMAVPQSAHLSARANELRRGRDG